MVILKNHEQNYEMNRNITSLAFSIGPSNNIHIPSHCITVFLQPLVISSF